LEVLSLSPPFDGFWLFLASFPDANSSFTPFGRETDLGRITIDRKLYIFNYLRNDIQLTPAALRA
jgi:hypothetical protein